MKKLTNYQRTAQYLNKVFKLINEEYFNNELEVPTITIQSTVGAYGHVSVNKVWHNDTIATHELNLSADYLNRPIENIVATLIHEGCHLYALQNNIKDTSNRGIYHNKRFRHALFLSPIYRLFQTCLLFFRHRNISCLQASCRMFGKSNTICCAL